MKVYEIKKGATNLEGLRQAERPEPKPGPNEVLVRLRAAALNYRDHAIVTGKYRYDLNHDTIPCSDGAGDVVAVGASVTRFKVGDRVIPTFFQIWIDGPPPKNRAALGAPLDGTLAELISLHEDGWVAMPKGLSYEEAATLPCAGPTAWNALMRAGTPIKPGDTVLCLGTGGVSMFALQFARAAGARVIVTSSSDQKIERACGFGASDGVNYKTHPDWEKEVLALTGGRGVDCVIENGGMGTLARSMQCVGWGGKVALIGVLSGREGSANPHDLMFKSASLQGIGVGSRASLEQLIQAVEVNRIKPIVEKTFPFDHAADAFRLQSSGNFLGKIVITI
ncbi:MAG TPA: NAD(P)-dependent alcohol dehydrogenase [Candidatus Acidoferrales bacterium]|nr:NAD(P)-dependent alcohol dehydrogenase [Candidatus Acidoferrales bacterium]